MGAWSPVLKRLANHLFWLARYLERAQWRARLVDVNYRLLVESPVQNQEEWWPLLAITGDWDVFGERYAGHDEHSVLEFFTFDQQNPSSIRSCVNFARENCRAARNRISSELWIEVNTLHLAFKEWSARTLQIRGVVGFFSDLREHFYRIAGVVDSTMPRDSAYDFLCIGRMLESAENVTRLLDTKYHFLLPRPEDVGSPLDLSQWGALLRSASALEAYRKRYGNLIKIDRVVDFMLFDSSFPRAARFCLEELQAALDRIAADSFYKNGGTPVPTAQRLGMRLRAEDAATVLTGGLHEYLLAMQEDCARIGDEIFNEYLKYE